MRISVQAGWLSLNLRIGRDGWESAHSDLGLTADELAEDGVEHAAMAFGFQVGDSGHG